MMLNHTIVWCRDKERSSRFMTELLGLPAAGTYGPFRVVELGNDVSLDFHEVFADEPIAPQHYAFLVSEDEFDATFERIVVGEVRHWADPAHREPDRINHDDGGRGVYFDDPDGHVLEIITRPYGGGS